MKMSSESGEKSSRVQETDRRKTRQEIRQLHDHVVNNRKEEVMKLLSSGLDLNTEYRNQTALEIAVLNGLDEICGILLARGSIVERSTHNGNSLLNFACLSAFMKVAEVLIEHGADVDSSNNDGNTPLHSCALSDCPSVAKLLCSAKCNCNRGNNQGETPLFLASKLGHVKFVEALVTDGVCDLDKKDENRKTPLIVAAENGFDQVVRVLVKGGCDLDSQDRYKCTALYAAIDNGQADIATLLIKEGARCDILSSKKVSPLLAAVQKSCLTVVKLLLEKGCDPNTCDYTEQGPLHAAVKQVSQGLTDDYDSDLKIITSLIDHGCDISRGDGSGWTPLHHCAFSGNVEVFFMLLSAGADVHAITQSGDSLLHSAVSGNSPEMVEILIQSGCNINHTNCRNELPLYCAVSSERHIDIIRMLITHGSELNVVEAEDRRTPFYAAVVNDYVEAATLLVQSGCDVNLPNSRFITPLCQACDHGNETLVKLIVSKPGCKLNRGFDQLPLHCLVHRGFYKLVELLLDKGANIDRVSSSGLTPVQVAIEDGNDEMIKMLIRWGCDLNASERTEISPFSPMKCCKLHNDPHPHIQLQPLFAAIKFEDIAMIKMLLTAHHTVPYNVVKTIYDIIMVGKVEGQRIIRDQFKMELLPVLKECLTNPQSLQILCRGILRQQLGVKPFEKVQKMNIPGDIKSLILFEKELDLKMRVAEHAPYGEEESGVGWLSED